MLPGVQGMIISWRSLDKLQGKPSPWCAKPQRVLSEAIEVCDVQMTGGMVLHEGGIAENHAAGEGADYRNGTWPQSILEAPGGCCR